MHSAADSEKSRHLVRYDYGLGELLWWIHARSAAEIVETLAGAEVVTDPEELNLAAGRDLVVLDLDGELPAPLTGMKAERIEQRGRPGFGALVGRSPVYLAWVSGRDGAKTRTLVELGADGRRIRQVEVDADGIAFRSSVLDWTSNPPHDLYDPQFAEMEVDKAEFEDAWNNC